MIEFFFSPDRPVAAALNGVILALTIVALIDAVLALSRAIRDQRLVTSVNASLPSGREEMRQALRMRAQPNKGVVADRVRGLSRLRASGQEIDHEMLAAVTAESLRSALPFASWARSVLVLFGLFGTLVGLGGALSNLSPLLAEGVIASDMVSAIGATVSQMTVAFSTTLAGVMGALLVSATVALVRARQSGLILALEDATTTVWLPLFQTTEQTRLTDAVKELERTRIALQEGLNNTRQSLDTGLKTTTDSVLKGFDKLEREFHARGGEILGELEDVRDATLAIIGERGADTPTLAEYVDTVQATTAKLEAGVDRTANLLPAIHQSLETTIEASHAALRNALTEHTERVLPVLERQESAAEALGKAVEDEIARLGTVHSVLEDLGRTLEGARETWARADDSIERLGATTAAALRDGLTDTLDQVGELTRQSSSSQARLASLVERFETTNENLFKAMSEQSRRSLNFSSEVVGEIRETLSESLARIGTEMTRAQEGHTAKLAEGLSDLARELRSLAGPGLGRSSIRSAGPARLALGSMSTSEVNEGPRGESPGEGVKRENARPGPTEE